MTQTNHEEPVRYSIKNQPDSREVAIDKLDELLISEEQVAAQLENSDADDFETDDAYGEWKSRAMGALGHIRAERKFLEKWLNAQRVPSKGQAVAPVATKLNGTTAAEGRTLITMTVNALLDAIKQSYTPMYSDEKLPPNQEAIDEQLEVIERLHADHVRVSRNLKETAKQYGIGEGSLKTLRRPLSDKINIMSRERDFLWEHNKKKVGIEDLFGVVLRLAERAEAHGLELNVEEQAIVKYARKKKAKNMNFEE